jgi:hypothetical protein
MASGQHSVSFRLYHESNQSSACFQPPRNEGVAALARGGFPNSTKTKRVRRSGGASRATKTSNEDL